MAATSQSPLAIPPGVKLDIKLELADGSLLFLTRKQVLKSLTIRDATVDAGLYTLTIPVDRYPANKVWQFFSLFDYIVDRADLAQQKVTLSQLIEMLPIADYFAAETLVDNLIDYILATILANPNMSEKVKKEVRTKYARLSDILQDAIYRRLIMSKTSIKDVRTVIPGQKQLKFLEVVVTDYGQIAVSYGQSLEESVIGEDLYDETESQRAKELNQLTKKITEGQINDSRFKLGGIVEDKISFLFRTRPYDDHIKVYKDKNEYYGPGQLVGVDITALMPNNSGHLLLYGNRVTVRDLYGGEGLNTAKLLSIYKTARINGQQFDELDIKIFTARYRGSSSSWGIYRIIELPSQKVLFSTPIPDMIYEDQGGKYVVAVTNISTGLATKKSANLIIELFEVDSKERLFRIIIDELDFKKNGTDEITIDVIRQLLYIKIDSHLLLHYSVTDSDLWTLAILVINFKGEIIHYYLVFDPYFINLRIAGSKLLAIEFHEEEMKKKAKGEFTIVQTGVFSGGSHIFIPGSEVTEYQKITELPAYEPFPDLPPLKPDDYQHNEEEDVFQYAGLWLRDSDNGYQPTALISDLPLVAAQLEPDTGVENEIKINSSPNGHYVILNAPTTGKVQVYKLTTYDQAEKKAIMDILSPPIEIQPELLVTTKDLTPEMDVKKKR